MYLEPSFISILFGVLVYSARVANATLQTPACSLNCTLTVVGAAGCVVADVTDVSACLCTNNVLLYELTWCVAASCNLTEQAIASEILHTELCVGAPQDNRQKEILCVEIVIAVFAFGMVALRLASRVLVARKVWWDDWMIVLCIILMVPNTAIPIYSVFIGFGKHIWDVSSSDIGRLNLMYWIASIFYALIQNIAKLSILFLYLRIFPALTFRRIVQATIAWQVCHMIAFTAAVIFQCTPVRSSWDLTIERTCINVNHTMKAGAFLSIFEDLFIMVLPISELVNLHLDLRKRLALCFMFALGSLACITSMVRLKFVWDYVLSLDGTWDDIDITLWSDIETYLAVICSCLMCIRPLLQKMFPALLPSTKSPTNSANPSSHRRTWGMKIGSSMRNSTTMIMSSATNKMTRWDDGKLKTHEDGITKTINFQVGNGSERSLHGIEMAERAESPSTFGRNDQRSENRSEVSVEDVVMRHGAK